MASVLTHFRNDGAAHMVDVGAKDETHRVAVAEGRIEMRPETLRLILAGEHDKGDVLGIARIAAIQAATLIDNIFSNAFDSDIILGNLIATISLHLPQFTITPNMFGIVSGNKSNIYERNRFKFYRENFILDYFFADWNYLLKTD